MSQRSRQSLRAHFQDGKGLATLACIHMLLANSQCGHRQCSPGLSPNRRSSKLGGRLSFQR